MLENKGVYMLKKLNLDIFRFIAALMIVAIHIYPLAVFNQNVDYFFTRVIFRIGVPLFLMITGFFVLPKALKDKNKLKDYTFKILKIYILSILIFLPINIYSGTFKNLDIINVLKDVFINGTMYHLWYFPALILGIWITYFLLKYFNKKLVLYILLMLYTIGLFGDSYYGLISDISLVNNFYEIIFKVFNYTRNGLFYVPIFLYIGFYCNTNNVKFRRNSFIVFILLLIVMGIEGIILKFNNIPRHTSMYMLLVPVSFMLFKILINVSNGSNKNLRNIGTWLYILHPLFIIVIRIMAKLFHLESIMVNNSFINYIFVVMSTLCCILVFSWVKRRVKNGVN